MDRQTCSHHGFMQIVLILACVVGCRQPAEPVTERASEQWPAEVAAFMAGVHRYTEATGAVPQSKEVLQDFCTASNLPCASVDWGKFTWQQATDGTVTVIYDLDGGTTLPISVAIPPAATRQDLGGSP